MNSNDDELDIRQYLTLLRKHVWLLIAIVVICVGVAGLYSYAQPKVYEATASVVLSDQQDVIGSTGALADPNAFQAQVGTQVQVAKSPSVAAVANQTLGALVPQVRAVLATGEANTRIMNISVQSKSPSVAATAANAYTKAYLQNRSDAAVNEVLTIANSVQSKQQQLQSQIDGLNKQLSARPAPSNASDLQAQVSSLNLQISQLQQQYTTVQAQATVRDSGASLLANAEVPSSPISPKPVRNTAIAGVLGILFGIGVILLLERLDDRIRSEDDVQHLAPHLSQLASVPRVTSWKKKAEAKAITLVEPQSPVAEAYRRLRTSIDFIGLDHPLQVIEITSATAEEGKSTTIANLATAMAWAGKRVIIVAADLRRPRVHEFFGISNSEGFTSILLSGDDVSSVLRRVQGQDGSGTVDVLATGPLPPNPAEFLSGQRVKDLFELLRRHADYILIDSPPVLPVADPVVLSSYADGVMLVVAADKLRRRQFEQTQELLSKAKAPLIGVVLNNVGSQSSYGHYESYYRDSRSATVPVQSVTRSNDIETVSIALEPKKDVSSGKAKRRRKKSASKSDKLEV